MSTWHVHVDSRMLSRTLLATWHVHVDTCMSTWHVHVDIHVSTWTHVPPTWNAYVDRRKLSTCPLDTWTPPYVHVDTINPYPESLGGG